MFATGIECSYPVVASADGGVRRVDEMAKCGHYRRWREDFQRRFHWVRFYTPVNETFVTATFSGQCGRRARSSATT